MGSVRRFLEELTVNFQRAGSYFTFASFDSTARLHSDSAQFLSKKDLLSAIASIKGLRTTQRNTGRALLNTRRWLIKANPDYPLIVIVILNGPASDEYKPAARYLMRDGVKVMVIVHGNNVADAEAQTIQSSAAMSFRTSFEDNSRAVSTLLPFFQSVCGKKSSPGWRKTSRGDINQNTVSNQWKWTTSGKNIKDRRIAKTEIATLLDMSSTPERILKLYFNVINSFSSRSTHVMRMIGAVDRTMARFSTFKSFGDQATQQLCLLSLMSKRLATSANVNYGSVQKRDLIDDIVKDDKLMGKRTDLQKGSPSTSPPLHFQYQKTPITSPINKGKRFRRRYPLSYNRISDDDVSRPLTNVYQSGPESSRILPISTNQAKLCSTQYVKIPGTSKVERQTICPGRKDEINRATETDSSKYDLSDLDSPFYSESKVDEGTTNGNLAYKSENAHDRNSFPNYNAYYNQVGTNRASSTWPPGRSTNPGTANDRMPLNNNNQNYNQVVRNVVNNAIDTRSSGYRRNQGSANFQRPFYDNNRNRNPVGTHRGCGIRPCGHRQKPGPHVNVRPNVPHSRPMVKNAKNIQAAFSKIDFNNRPQSQFYPFSQHLGFNPRISYENYPGAHTEWVQSRRPYNNPEYQNDLIDMSDRYGGVDMDYSSIGVPPESEDGQTYIDDDWTYDDTIGPPEIDPDIYGGDSAVGFPPVPRDVRVSTFDGSQGGRVTTFQKSPSVSTRGTYDNDAEINAGYSDAVVNQQAGGRRLSVQKDDEQGQTWMSDFGGGTQTGDSQFSTNQQYGSRRQSNERDVADGNTWMSGNDMRKQTDFSQFGTKQQYGGQGWSGDTYSGLGSGFESPIYRGSGTRSSILSSREGTIDSRFGQSGKLGIPNKFYERSGSSRASSPSEAGLITSILDKSQESSNTPRTYKSSSTNGTRETRNLKINPRLRSFTRFMSPAHLIMDRIMNSNTRRNRAQNYRPRRRQPWCISRTWFCLTIKLRILGKIMAKRQRDSSYGPNKNELILFFLSGWPTSLRRERVKTDHGFRVVAKQIKSLGIRIVIIVMERAKTTNGFAETIFRTASTNFIHGSWNEALTVLETFQTQSMQLFGQPDSAPYGLKYNKFSIKEDKAFYIIPEFNDILPPSLETYLTTKYLTPIQKLDQVANWQELIPGIRRYFLRSYMSVVIVVDVAQGDNALTIRRAIDHLIQMFDKDVTSFSLVFAKKYPKIEYQNELLKTDQKRRYFVSRVDFLRLPSRNVPIGKTLELVRTNLIPRLDPRRRKMVILIAQHASIDRVEEAASRLKDDGVVISVIGIESGINIPELQTTSSSGQLLVTGHVSMLPIMLYRLQYALSLVVNGPNESFERYTMAKSSRVHAFSTVLRGLWNDMAQKVDPMGMYRGFKRNEVLKDIQDHNTTTAPPTQNERRGKINPAALTSTTTTQEPIDHTDISSSFKATINSTHVR